MPLPMPIIVLWVVLSLIIACFGKRHRFGVWGLFFCSILLTPFVGILVLAAGYGVVANGKRPV